MTVAELIESLRDVSQDAVVKLPYSEEAEEVIYYKDDNEVEIR